MSKPIAEMDLKELSEHAVTLADWDWKNISGMFDMKNTWRVVKSIGGYMDNAIVYELNMGRLASVPADYFKEVFRPDFGCQATLGCLLWKVRNKHGKQCHTRYCPEYGWFLDAGDFGPPIGYERELVRVGSTIPVYVGFESEPHAMIAALIAEVRP